MEINYDIIRTQVFEYVDKDALVTKLKDLGATNLDPFKYNNAGKPIGFSDTLMKAEGFAGELIHYLLWAVEKICADAGEIAKGGEKKKALVQFIDNCIKLPFFFESFDDNIIEWLIDKGVESLNKAFGKDWVNHIPTPVLAKLTPTPPATDDIKEPEPEKAADVEPPTPPATEDAKEPEPEKAKKGKSK